MNYSPELLRAVTHSGSQTWYLQDNTLRADDIWLASYPRSGNHFVRFMIVSALSWQATGRFPDDFSTMNLVPGIHSGPPAMRTTPRIIKTHFPFDPRYRRIIHLIRDPRDVLVSYYHYTHKLPQLFMNQQQEPPDAQQFTELFLSGDVWPGDVRTHTESFAAHAADTEYLLLRYEDLIDAPAEHIPHLLNFLEISLDSDVIGQLIRHTSFENMSRLFEPESALRGGVPPSRDHVVRQGKAGGYREFLGDNLAAVNDALDDYLERFAYT